jgi:hypothetical protein
MLRFRSQCVELKEGPVLKSNIYELLSAPEAVHPIMFSRRIIKAHERTHSTGLYVYMCIYTHTHFFCGSTALEDLGLRLFDVSRSYSDTLSTAPLDVGSASRRDFYLTTHNNHMSQTSIPPAGLEPAKPASERPLTHTLNRPVTGIGYAHVHIN